MLFMMTKYFKKVLNPKIYVKMTKRKPVVHTQIKFYSYFNFVTEWITTELRCLS